MRSPFGSLDSTGIGWIPRPHGFLEPLWWVARALWIEMLGFRFHYPIELVAEGGPRTSLHYYVYSDRLFFDAMELDRYGVPCQRSRVLGTFYNPAYIAWYGLMSLEQALREGKTDCGTFRVQTEWLISNAVRREDGSIIWPYPVDIKEGGCRLKTPWISAMSQGLALSVLVRAHRLGWGSPELIELCRAAIRVYEKDVTDGGIRSFEHGQVLYEEYPSYPLPRVLDGFLFGLLGLYDLWIETGEPIAKELFEKGISGLVHKIEFWNYDDKWSWYGLHRYLCPPHYHNLNRLLLSALANITGEKLLSRYAEAWDPARLSLVQRAWLFAIFTCLKQWSRVKALVGQLGSS